MPYKIQVNSYLQGKNLRAIGLGATSVGLHIFSSHSKRATNVRLVESSIGTGLAQSSGFHIFKLNVERFGRNQ